MKLYRYIFLILLYPSLLFGVAPSPVDFKKLTDDEVINLTGDDDFNTRILASKELFLRGNRLLYKLKNTVETSKDPEIVRRCSRVIHRLDNVRFGKWIDAIGKELPCLDSAWYHPVKKTYEDPEDWFGRILKYFISPYLERISRDSFPHKQYRFATQLWLRDVFDSGVPFIVIYPVIYQMKYRDQICFQELEKARKGPGIIEKPDSN